jgi:hypothetical protein
MVNFTDTSHHPLKSTGSRWIKGKHTSQTKYDQAHHYGNHIIHYSLVHTIGKEKRFQTNRKDWIHKYQRPPIVPSIAAELGKATFPLHAGSNDCGGPFPM